jgi:hypothetical protein
MKNAMKNLCKPTIVNPIENGTKVKVKGKGKVKGRTLGGLAAPQTPSLLNDRGKVKGRTLGFAQTQQGNNSPAPLIVKTVSKCAILN